MGSWSLGFGASLGFRGSLAIELRISRLSGFRRHKSDRKQNESTTTSITTTTTTTTTTRRPTGDPQKKTGRQRSTPWRDHQETTRRPPGDFRRLGECFPMYCRAHFARGCKKCFPPLQGTKLSITSVSFFRDLLTVD